MTDPPFSPLVADVITAMVSQTHDVTTHLIDSLTAQLANSHAEVDAIREGVLKLLSGPCMPTPLAIERALFPSTEERDRFRRAA